MVVTPTTLRLCKDFLFEIDFAYVMHEKGTETLLPFILPFKIINIYNQCWQNLYLEYLTITPITQCQIQRISTILENVTIILAYAHKWKIQDGDPIFVNQIYIYLLKFTLSNIILFWVMLSTLYYMSIILIIESDVFQAVQVIHQFHPYSMEAPWHNSSEAFVPIWSLLQFVTVLEMQIKWHMTWLE